MVTDVLYVLKQLPLISGANAWPNNGLLICFRAVSDYCIKFVFTKGDPLPTQWSICVCVCMCVHTAFSNSGFVLLCIN